jgi:hypothetical protein
VTNIGYLCGYVLGHFLSYETTSWIMLPCPLVFIVCIIFLPETPYCLLRKKLNKEAEKSLMFYRGFTNDTKKTPELMDELYNFTKSVEMESCPVDGLKKIALKEFCEYTQSYFETFCDIFYSLYF